MMIQVINLLFGPVRVCHFGSSRSIIISTKWAKNLEKPQGAYLAWVKYGSTLSKLQYCKSYLINNLNFQNSEFFSIIKDICILNSMSYRQALLVNLQKKFNSVCKTGGFADVSATLRLYNPSLSFLPFGGLISLQLFIVFVPSPRIRFPALAMRRSKTSNGGSQLVPQPRPHAISYLVEFRPS